MKTKTDFYREAALMLNDGYAPDHPVFIKIMELSEKTLKEIQDFANILSSNTFDRDNNL